MLKEEVGIDLEPFEIIETWVWDFEVSKYDVVSNAKMLRDEGLFLNIILDLIFYAPDCLLNTNEGLQNHLVSEFGDDYIDEMNQMDEEKLIDLMYSW